MRRKGAVVNEIGGQAVSLPNPTGGQELDAAMPTARAHELRQEAN